MKLARALAALWDLTSRRQRLIAGALIVLMFVASAFEMGGMLVLFAYISGLGEDGAAGARGGLRYAFELVFPEAGPMAFALIGGLIVIGVFVFKNVLAVGVSFAITRFLMKLYEHITPRLLQGFLDAPYERILLRGTAEPTRIVNQMLELFNSCLGSAMQVISDLVLIAMIAALLLFVDPLLTALACTMFGMALVLMHAATRKILVRMGDEAVDMQRQSQKIVAESFGGLISARLNGTTDAFVARYSRYIHRAALLNRRRRALAQLPRMSNEVLLAAGIVAAVLYFGVRGQGIEAAVPTLALFGLAGLRLTTALSRLSGALQLINERQGEFDMALDTIRSVAPELSRSSPASASAQGGAGNLPLLEGAPGHFSDALELRGVTFTFPQAARPALDRIDLDVGARAFTAFCGPSGSGKSTLLLVMMGLIRPDRGLVLCDGWSVFDHIGAWHARIGYVGQRPFVAARSVRENVAFGRPPEAIDEEKVWHALELARLADVVRQLPQQLSSTLGEDGSHVSGGQRQRLDIARALYDDPDILFLDEATAALDNVTEREVTEAIRGLSGDKTIICVAHRLTTVREADVIHLMESGRVTASGTYEALIRDTPAFRKMAEAGRAA